MMRQSGRPTEGRSCNVRVYRLWMREDAVPHEGQEAVGDVVRRFRVISSATSTPSTWNSGRSRKMIIGFDGFLEKASTCEKMFNSSVYHISYQQTCVSSKKWPCSRTISWPLTKARSSFIASAQRSKLKHKAP